MTSFLRNFKKNNIKVIYISDLKAIRKFTYNPRYFDYIKNEINGIKWYKKN